MKRDEFHRAVVWVVSQFELLDAFRNKKGRIFIISGPGDLEFLSTDKHGWPRTQTTKGAGITLKVDKVWSY